MSEQQNPGPESPGTPPQADVSVRSTAPARGLSLSGLLRWLRRMVFTLSIGLNLLFILAILAQGGSFGGGGGALSTRFYSGNRHAKNKIAVVKIDRLIVEGMIDYARRQIQDAQEDDHVKAVVVRIDSPGGTITASDELYRRLKDLRDGVAIRYKGDPEHKVNKKSLVVSMGAIAASGGYYVAMPASYLVAERTTITGSIGVYVAFPNIAQLSDKYGIRMEVIKRGDMKYSGSMFREMSPQERQVWQDGVDNAYEQFLSVVQKGRPNLKDKLLKTVIDKTVTTEEKPGKPETFVYKRKLADGGTFTPEQAKQFGLIDEIGYVEAAIAKAQQLAGLGANDFKVITYDRPQSFLFPFLAEQSSPEEKILDPKKWSTGLAPRLWYLTPQSEMAGFFAAVAGD